MGKNYKDYFKEAYRTLKPFGYIFIAEPLSKWDGRESELEAGLIAAGFSIHNNKKLVNFYM